MAKNGCGTHRRPAAVVALQDLEFWRTRPQFVAFARAPQSQDGFPAGLGIGQALLKEQPECRDRVEHLPAGLGLARRLGIDEGLEQGGKGGRILAGGVDLRGAEPASAEGYFAAISRPWLSATPRRRKYSDRLCRQSGSCFNPNWRNCCSQARNTGGDAPATGTGPR